MPKRAMNMRSRRHQKRKRRYRVPRTAKGLAYRAIRLALSARPQLKCVTFCGNNASTSTPYQLSQRLLVRRYDEVSTDTVGPDEISKWRPTGVIPQGANEDQRIGDQILIKYLQMDMVFLCLRLHPPDAFNPPDYFDRTTQMRKTIRVMVIGVFDQTEPSGTIPQCPELHEIFEGVIGTAGVVTTFAPLTTHSVMHGTYKPVHSKDHEGTSAQDRQLMRYRSFTVYYDRIINLKDPDVRTTLGSNNQGADQAETSMSTNIYLNLRVPLNHPVEYLSSTSETRSEIKGNLYVMVFQDENLIPIATQWPTIAGTMNQNTISVVMRARGRCFFVDK